MRRQRTESKATCPHDEEHWEQCGDGHYCLACDEGVCPDCRKKWKPNGVVNETGDFEVAPACRCNQAPGSEP